MYHRSNAGSVLTEFMIIMPIMMALFIGLFSLHEALEDRMVKNIWLRNSAALVDKDERQQVDHLKHYMGRSNLIAREQDLEVKEKERNNLVFRGYKIKLSRLDSELSSADLDRVSEHYPGDHSSYADISKVQGQLTGIARPAWQGLIDLGGLFKKQGGLINQGASKVNYESTTQSSAALLVFDGWSSARKSMRYVRVGAGYHPSEYRYQGLLGFAWGRQGAHDHWSMPYELKFSGRDIFSRTGGVSKGFVAHCLMNFVADNTCFGPSPMSAVIRGIAVGKGIAQLIADFFSLGSAAAANEAAKEAINLAIDGLADSMKEELERAVADKIGQQVEQKVSALLDDKLKPVKQRISQKLDIFKEARAHGL